MKNAFGILGATLLLASALNADPILSFSIEPLSSGSVSYDGAGGPLVGTGIDVESVVLIDGDTGLPMGAEYAILNGELSFTTGPLDSASAAGWEFEGGNSSVITIWGTIDVNGNGVADAGEPSGALLVGELDQASVFKLKGSIKLSVASFDGNKNADLLALYGLPSVPYTGNIEIVTNGPGAPPGGFQSSLIVGGHITTNPVPEPATILLVGAGLVALGLRARRRVR